MGTVEKRDKHKKRRFVSPEEKLERELKDCMIVDSSGDITTDVPMEHVVNHLRKKNRSFQRNVSVVRIIGGMVIVFLVCES